MKTDHVLVRLLHARYALFFASALYRAKLVAIDGRPLVVQLVRRDLHSIIEIADQLAVPPLEEAGYVGNLGPILRFVDVEHAGSRAALDLILKTGTGSEPQLRVRAGPKLEVSVHQSQRLPRRGRRVIRTEVLGAVGLRASNDLQSRPWFLRIESYR